MIINITPAKRRFGGRKQWKFAITGDNHEPIDPRDTYANVGDIMAILQKLRHDRVEVRVHYTHGIETTVFTPQRWP